MLFLYVVDFLPLSASILTESTTRASDMEIGSVGIGGYRAVTKTTADGGQQALFFRKTSDDTGGRASTAPLTGHTRAISSQMTGALLVAQEQAGSTLFFARSSLSSAAPAEASPVVQAESVQPAASSASQPPSYERRSDSDFYSYRTDTTDADFSQAAAVRSGLSFTNEAPQVDQATADLLKKVAGVYDPDRTAGIGGTVTDLVDLGQALSTTTFSFALNRDTANFAVQAEGDLGGLSLLDALKNGTLQIDVQKWGGVGNAGLNASTLSLSGAAYNVATFGDGDIGTTNIRHNQSDLGTNMVGATFGGWSARDGLTFTVRSYDPTINVTGLKLLIP